MDWLELIFPFCALLSGLPCVALAYIYSRTARHGWRFRLFRFVASSVGVSVLMVVSIFLRHSGIVVGFVLYFVVWSIVFVLLAAAGSQAIGVSLLVIGSDWKRPWIRLYVLASAAAYAATAFFGLRGDGDLFFPYIQGAFSATTLYLLAALSISLFALLLNLDRLCSDDRKALKRFLLIFVPLVGLTLADEILRDLRRPLLPKFPFIPLIACALYVFAFAEILRRMRLERSPGAALPAGTTAESLAAAVADSRRSAPLTQRERDILVELLKGTTNAGIAAGLGISQNTVKNHVYNIYQKTGMGSRKDLYAFALSRAARPQDGI